jgi:hypothetical protein
MLSDASSTGRIGKNTIKLMLTLKMELKKIEVTWRVAAKTKGAPRIAPFVV